MNLSETIKMAADTFNPKLAAKASDVCRFRMGMNYAETAAFFAKHGCDADDFEALMYEADTLAM